MYKEVLLSDDVQEIERLYDRKGVAFAPAFERSMNAVPQKYLLKQDREGTIYFVANMLLTILNNELELRAPRTVAGRIIRGILKFITRK